MSGYRSEEKLPGDFDFKVVEGASQETGSDDLISLGAGIGVLSVSFVLFALLFFSTFSLHAKLHLFVLLTAIGAIIYNYRVYGKPEMGASYLDSYYVEVIPDEGVPYELGRFGKWRRLMWSFGEPPNPEFHEESGEEPSRTSASARTLLEWAILTIAICMAVYNFGRYWYASNGPYFHDIFGYYVVALLIGLLFWLALWVKHRINDEWDEIRRHVEAFNFFVCRWLMGYLVVWGGIALLWIIDD